MFKTYQEAETYVMSRRKQENENEFSDFKMCMEKLGNPYEALKIIHVAGTNGKGSTANYLSDLLQLKYDKVGLFTSPHLTCHRDRIRINGEWISEEDYLRIANQVYELIERYQLSMFTIVTMIAFLYFKEKQVDYVVLEVGIGGRKDTTNVITKPSLCIITSIGYDHMNLLGNTLKEIAFEKAGIIKENVPIVIGDMEEEPKLVIQEVAKENNAPFYEAFSYHDLGKQKIQIKDTIYTLATSAEYQKKNASLALKVWELLGFSITEPEVVTCIQNSMWKGRFEQIGNIILDGAHNPEGIEALIQSFKNLERPIVVIFTALKDKQGKEMADALRKNADYFLVTEINYIRGNKAEALTESEEEIVSNWKDALKKAQAYVKDKGTIVISGSLYFISEARAYLLVNK